VFNKQVEIISRLLEQKYIRTEHNLTSWFIA